MLAISFNSCHLASIASFCGLMLSGAGVVARDCVIVWETVRSASTKMRARERKNTDSVRIQCERYVRSPQRQIQPRRVVTCRQSNNPLVNHPLSEPCRSRSWSTSGSSWLSSSRERGVTLSHCDPRQDWAETMTEGESRIDRAIQLVGRYIGMRQRGYMVQAAVSIAEIYT